MVHEPYEPDFRLHFSSISGNLDGLVLDEPKNAPETGPTNGLTTWHKKTLIYQSIIEPNVGPNFEPTFGLSS